MNFTRRYIDITNLVKQEFDRNVVKYGDKIQCRKGCSQCCHQIFRITAIDAYFIQEHLRSMTTGQVKILKEKAMHYLGARGKTNDKIACPALGQEGECTIYEGRPIVCRRFGIPMYDYKHPEKIYACELNFSDGEEINDPELIPNQTATGKKWDELKEAFNAALNAGASNSTTIAEAIAEFKN